MCSTTMTFRKACKGELSPPNVPVMRDLREFRSSFSLGRTCICTRPDEPRYLLDQITCVMLLFGGEMNVLSADLRGKKYPVKPYDCLANRLDFNFNEVRVTIISYSILLYLRCVFASLDCNGWHRCDTDLLKS